MMPAMTTAADVLDAPLQAADGVATTLRSQEASRKARISSFTAWVV